MYATEQMWLVQIGCLCRCQTRLPALRNFFNLYVGEIFKEWKIILDNFIISGIKMNSLLLAMTKLSLQVQKTNFRKLHTNYFRAFVNTVMNLRVPQNAGNLLIT
jgi:hypothetical protein